MKKNYSQIQTKEKNASSFASFFKSSILKCSKTLLAFLFTAFFAGNLLATTPNYTVNVKTSDGSNLSGVKIRYNNFGNNYAEIGTTDANGNISAFLSSGTYNFKAIYNSSEKVISATISGSGNSQIDFQTSKLTSIVQDCGDNSLLSGVQIRYNNFGSNTIPMGNTDNNGEVSFELFPGTYNISAVTNSTTSTKSVTLGSSGASVTFNPTKVCFTFNGQVRYNNFGSNTVPFNCNTYLFPGTYGFKFGGTSAPTTQVAISGCSFTATAIKLVDENDNNLANFSGSYRSRCGGSWTYNNVSFTTDANGLAILNTSCSNNNWDGKITINVNQTSVEQVVATNSVYQLSKVNVILKDCAGNSLSGGIVEQGGGSWVNQGTTNSNGTVSFYAFASNNVTARMKYNYGTQTISGTTVTSPVTNINFTTTKVNIGGGTVQVGVSGWPTVSMPYEMLSGTYNFRVAGSQINGIEINGCNFDKTLLRVFNESNEPVEGVTFTPACGGSWQSQLGATNSNGLLFTEIPSCMTKIKAQMTNSDREMSKSQLENSDYTFTAEKVSIKLINTAGNAITDQTGSVSQGGGSWTALGNLNNQGKLFINTFSAGKYRVTYNNTTEEKTTTITVGSGIQEIVFQTGTVVSTCGHSQISAGGWSAFTSGNEYMPGSRTFKSPSTTKTVIAGQTIDLCDNGDYTINTSNNNQNSSNFDGISIFPNPSSDLLNVIVAADDKSNVTFNIFDAVTGKSVYNFSSIGSINQTVDVSGFSSGLYYIQINNGGKLNNQKFIVK
jgi:hypothetical protein